jgi:LacI family transcriptional regulator
VGVLSYFNDNKIKVPQQVAVIGFSNWFMSQVLTPKLSTVDQPSHLMGVEAFNLLLEEMNCHKKENRSPRTIELETSIIRESSVEFKKGQRKI